MRTLVGVLVIAALAGCASYEQTLRSDSGNERTCAFSAPGVVGLLWAKSRQEECVAAAQARGFR